MTRHDKQDMAAVAAARVAGKIERLGYFHDNAVIRVAFGPPGARKFAPKKGQGSVRARLRKRGVMIGVPEDWESTVYDAGLAVVDDDGGTRVLVLEARPASAGDIRGWEVTYLMAGPYGLIHVEAAHLVEYAGRHWMSATGLTEAFGRAVATLAANLTGEAVGSGELPF
jgi:hypothetical protein